LLSHPANHRESRRIASPQRLYPPAVILSAKIFSESRRTPVDIFEIVPHPDDPKNSGDIHDHSNLTLCAPKAPGHASASPGSLRLSQTNLASNGSGQQCPLQLRPNSSRNKIAVCRRPPLRSGPRCRPRAPVEGASQVLDPALSAAPREHTGWPEAPRR